MHESNASIDAPETAGVRSHHSLAAHEELQIAGETRTDHLRVAADLGGLRAPMVEGRPHWPLVAVPRWVEAARRAGFDAVDRTYERIDSQRDTDDCYGGTVQVGGRLLDLYVDERGVVRVVTDDRYLL